MMFRRKKKQNTERADVATPQQPQELSVIINQDTIHESGYVLRDGEQIIAAAERVLSPKGDGWLLVTNMEFLYIHDKEGIYLNLQHSMIESLVVENSNNKILVSWNETNGSFDYPMKVKSGVKSAQRMVSQINDAFHYKKSSAQHAELSESEANQARVRHAARFEKFIESERQNVMQIESKLDGIADGDPDKQSKTLELLSQITKSNSNIRIYEKNIEYIKERHIVRSYKIPKDIDIGNVWNDCYYDESRKAFVTFNKHYEENLEARTRDIQKQFDSEMGSNAGIIIDAEKITFRFGYPVRAGKNQNDHHVWGILCTMADSMLTDEIVLARLKPKKSYMESVMYYTESEQWISKGKDMKICERELEVSTGYL